MPEDGLFRPKYVVSISVFHRQMVTGIINSITDTLIACSACNDDNLGFDPPDKALKANRVPIFYEFMEIRPPFW